MRPIPHEDRDEPEHEPAPLTTVPEDGESELVEAEDSELWLDAQEF
jgi:hypothetical protein